MATTAPDIPLVWTTGADEQGVRLDYTLYWKNGTVETKFATCLGPDSFVTLASNDAIASCAVTNEDVRKRPKVTVKMRADPPEAATASGDLELWCLISGVSCGQVTTSGSITLTYDRARWVPTNHGQTWPPSWSGWGLGENFVRADFDGGNTAYSAGSANVETAVVPFAKTREEVTVSATYGGSATASPDPLPPGDADGISFSGYERDTVVTLAAGDPEDECYVFDHWEYTGSGEDPHGIHGSTSSTVTLTALPNYRPDGSSGYTYRSTSYRAVYRKRQFTLTVEVSPQGVAQAPAPEVLDCGSSWSPLAPVPDDPCDYQFAYWSDGETDQRHPTMRPTSDATLTAVYTRVEYHLSVSVYGDGTYSVSPQLSAYHYGDEVYITVTPGSPCSYVGSVSGVTQESDGRYKVTMDDCLSSTKYVSVNFYRYSYSVTTSVSPEGSGTVSPSSALNVPCGGNRTFTAVPSACFRFLRWSTGSTDPTLNVLVDSNKALVAYFEALPVDHRLLHGQDTGQLLYAQLDGSLLWAGCRGQTGT